MSESYDVIVVGGGNAALCAAIAAREAGCRVLVLERSPEHVRGGNTRHTRNIRCSHAAGDQFFSGPYSEEEHLQDLIGVTGGPANLDLAKLAIRESSTLPGWMSAHGVHWQQPLAGTLHLGRTNRWFLGGGKALLNTYYRTAGRMGIGVRYNALVEDLVIEDNRFEAVRLKNENGGELIRARAVVVAAGGYEANIEWLKRYWGDAADNFIIRGTPYNDGTLLAALLKHGAKSIGDPKGFHAIAVDARAPKFDGGIVTRLDVVPFGIVVNRDARRFYDEGEEIWPKRYAIWGTQIAGQPGQIAYGIVDAKAIDRFLPPMFKPYQAETLEDLALQLGLAPRTFADTVTEYNRAAAGNTVLCMERLDGNCTRGLTPPKSNWAIPIDRPPFYGLPLRPGITFTYMGVTVDECARVVDQNGRSVPECFRGGRNYVREHSHERLSWRFRPDDRLRVRQACGQGGGGKCQGLMSSRKPVASSVICNACRYCEGYCPVFRAVEIRRDFKQGDVFYLSNLCHDCRACYYACMYTPPHEFAINIPQILAESRIETYRRWSWPDFLGRAFKNRSVTVFLATGMAALVAVLALLFVPSRNLFAAHLGSGAFYEVVPYVAMVAGALILFFYGIAVWLRGGARFWSETRGVWNERGNWKTLAAAMGAALGLRYLKGGGPGCFYPDERPSSVRRVYHSLTFWGLTSDFVSTTLAFVYQDFFHILPPYSLTSAPVIFGSLGGVALIIGTGGLIYFKLQSDREPAGAAASGMDYVFLVTLGLTALTGMLTLILRATSAMGSILVLHLACIAALFISAPYGKFVHAVYRTLALIRYKIEQSQSHGTGGH